MPDVVSPAEQASQEALANMYECLKGGQSFRLEAGAGAGKTYSLVKALMYLSERHHRDLTRKNQQIACITFTNVAKDEINARTDRSPVIYCDTNHAFCWSLIQGFQKQLRSHLSDSPVWQERIAEAGGLGSRSIEYSLGHRSIKEHSISLGHEDILPLSIKLMENEKFRRLMSARFPIILIDEYQDTDSDWIQAIKNHYLGKDAAPLFGFFGDHWQKIYGNGCGTIDHPAITVIGKKANFRSVKTIVDCLNRMRPDLPQFVSDPDALGDVRVIHSNAWIGDRQAGAHWGGDLPSDVGHALLQRVKHDLTESGWDFSAAKTKVLMLTHRLLASEQGYSSLPGTFRYNESFTKKEHPLIAFLVDELEPACDAFLQRRYGEMFSSLNRAVPLLNRHADKVSWSRAMNSLVELRQNGTVGDIVDHLRQVKHPRLPDALIERDSQAQVVAASQEEDVPPATVEWNKLRAVQYQEIISLRSYLSGFSPFETKHGVKGAEFENVLVVIGRGWNQYNFGEMLELAQAPQVPPAKAAMFERNRNLFYVACSRPKRRLALLFTQKLSDAALGTLSSWFGPDTIQPAEFPV
ncbi:UvrD-helicase domain-containing protein [Rhodopseudomonas sp. P1]|uniref:UvrD-helicase domain-containing protein n=1 Tax=Rhodopseudomonas sp. P1 TaxID=3434357 RepID=UPI0031FBF515